MLPAAIEAAAVSNVAIEKGGDIRGNLELDQILNN
jgi:hypothetical protein